MGGEKDPSCQTVPISIQLCTSQSVSILPTLRVEKDDVTGYEAEILEKRRKTDLSRISGNQPMIGFYLDSITYADRQTQLFLIEEAE
jgi:hypothetical protein